MMDAIIRLAKAYRYQVLGFFGIALMAIPIILVDNLKLISRLHSSIADLLLPVFRSTWFPPVFTAIELTGVVIIFFAIYMANRTNAEKHD